MAAGPAATMRCMAVSSGPAPAVGREGGDADRFLNRELSWLDFNARVLALAEDSTRPLLERAKFLAIFSMNLDEFFQVRVSGLQEQVAAGIRTRSPDGLDPLETIRAIREQVRTLVERQTTIFTKVEGVAYSSVMITGNLRQAIEGLFAAVSGQLDSLRGPGIFAALCIAFGIGAAVGAYAARLYA